MKGNSVETMSIKALSRKALERNFIGNLVERLGFQGGNFEVKNEVKSFP